MNDCTRVSEITFIKSQHSTIKFRCHIYTKCWK